MISAKLAIGISILVAIAGSGVLAFVLDYQARERRKEFRQTSVDAVQLLALAIAPAVAAGRHERVQSVLDNVAIYPQRFPDVDAIEVISREGTIIAALDPREYNTTSMRVRYSELNSSSASVVHALTGELLEIIVPIRVTYPLGAIRAVMKEQRLAMSLDQQRARAIWLVIAISIAVAVALYLMLRRIVGSRIVQLAAVSTSFRQGRMNARAKVDGADEIAQLADSFNRMADSINAYTTNLEHLVAERTSALRIANERLAQLAITDPLTALFNRRHFEERAGRDLEVAKRAQRPFAVLVMDVDRFKQVNDQYGHLVGDTVLRGVAHVLMDNARAADLVSRIGGEEFAIAMPDTTAHEAAQAAERIRAQLETYGPPNAPELKGEVVTVSFGVAAFPDHGDSLRMLMSAADSALYRAKDRGRNRVEQAAVGQA